MATKRASLPDVDTSSPLKRPKFSIAELLYDEDDEEEDDEEEDDEVNENETEDNDVAFCLKTNATSSTDGAATSRRRVVHEDKGQLKFGVAIKQGNLDVECKLEGSELWAKFYDLGTEMIITKSGRRMFPTVKVSFSNVLLDSLYYVFLDVIPVDSKRYRYIYNKSAWLTAGKAEPVPRNRLYLHPDCPFTGEQLLKHVISFEKTKLTNNEVDKTGHLILNSMHKYQPRIHIVQRSKHNPLDPTKICLSDELHSTFTFHETQFMAVTAYQNQLITKLKIEKNPFAKGFRDPSGRSPDEIERGGEVVGPPTHLMLSNFYPNASAIQQSLLQQCFGKTFPPINPILSQMLLYPNFLSTIGGGVAGAPKSASSDVV